MKYLYIYLIVCCIFCCCSESTQESQHQKILFSQDTIYKWHGTNDTIEILSPNISDLICHSENEKIAKANIKGRQFIISMGSMGKALIHIEGTPNWCGDIEVNVKGLDGYWQESEYPNSFIKYDVILHPDDTEFSMQLRKHLLDSIQNYYHTSYTFGFDDIPLVVKMQGESYYGDYIYDDVYSKLYLNYGLFHKIYDVEQYSPSVFKLTENLTEEYKKLYKNQNLTEVKIIKYIIKVRKP